MRRQKNINDCQEFSLEELLLASMVFMQSKYFWHDEMHKKLTAFLSMSHH